MFVKKIVKIDYLIVFFFIYTLNQFAMLFRKIVIEKSFINWRALPLVKVNTRVFETPV
jgi:hypothetical protein